MKQPILIAALSILSAQAMSFEDLVQDVDENETITTFSYGAMNNDVTFSNGNSSTSSSVDTDNISASLTHALPINSDYIAIVGGDFEQSEADGASEHNNEIMLGIINNKNDEALGVAFKYAVNEDASDVISFDLHKELSFQSSSKLDGELLLSLSLSEETSEVSGGNSFSTGFTLRSTLTPQLQLQGGAGVLMISDREFKEDELTFSYDPAFVFTFGLDYAIVPGVYFGLFYSNSSADGTVTDGVNSIDAAYKLTGFNGSLKATF